ncbi:MAG: hypothetical protein J5590_09125 [Clostridia bacterium]|nr:hypothetical protein [Clostridia bacterium]
MAVSVRDTLERLGFAVGYDGKTGGVTVKGKNGKTVNIGSEGFTLGDDNRYYAGSTKDIYSLLSKNGLAAGEGWSAVRNTLSPTESVGYNSKTGQLAVNGKTYNVDDENLANIGGIIYGKSDYVDSLKKERYKNPYEDLERKVLKELMNNKYEGYDPEKDEDYQKAYADYVRNAKADMGSRGITSDSLISHYASEGAAKLMPEFRKADYEKYKDENEKLRTTLYAMKNLDENERNAFKTREESDYKAAELEAKRENNMLKEIADDVNMAVKRAKAFGTVNGRDAEILGVPPGTLTESAREKIESRAQELEKLKLQNEHDMQMALTKGEIDAAKSERSFEQDKEKIRLEAEAKKEIARLQNDLDISKAQATSYFKALYGK